MLERWEDVAIRLEVTNDFPGRRGLNSRFRTRKELLLMVQSEIRRENQLRLVVYPIIYKVFYIQVVVWDFFQQYGRSSKGEGDFSSKSRSSLKLTCVEFNT